MTRLRIAVVGVLGVLLAVGAGGAFDAVQPPVFVPAVAVAVAAAAAVELRSSWRWLLEVLALAFGIALAVVLAGGGPGDVFEAVVSGPRQLLTTEWPSPAVATVVGAVAAAVGVFVMVAADLAGRSRWHLAPLAPITVGWLVVLAIGAPVRPPPWVGVGVALAAVALATLRHRGVEAGTDGSGDRRPTLVLDRTVVISIAVVFLTLTATATALAFSGRADPRRTEDAETNAALLDPIEAVVALRAADPPFAVYTVTDRSRVVGQSLPARWRLQALDEYDGQRWVPRLTLRPIGGRLGLVDGSDPNRPPPVSYTVEFGDGDLDLIPFPGEPLAADVDVETDLDRVVVRPLDRPEVGDQVSVESQVALTSRSEITGIVALRQIDEVAAGFGELANRLAGSGTAIEQLRRLEQIMSEEWQLDPEAPGSGQQLALIDRFLTDTQRGTREQFVTGFVLLARSLGYDARVASGFVVPPGDLRSPLVLDSGMAAVWPEVSFEDAGWVAFDPEPDLETADLDEPPPPPEAQTPAAAQPPIAPPVDDVDAVDDETTTLDASTDGWGAVRVWLVRVGVVAGFTVLPLLAAIALIVGLKWRRRRRRLHAADPSARVRGAWANTTDALVDAGLTIKASWTDDGIARHAVVLAPDVPHEMRRLAALSTRMTFGTTAGAAGLADDAVTTSSAIDEAIGSRLTRWQRLRWQLSLRSFRAATRSPVLDR